MSDKKKCPKGGKGIGGQAVIEGVMMRGRTMYALAVRTPDKKIAIEKTKLNTDSKMMSFWKLPIFRGMYAFVSSLVTGMKVISKSAELAGVDEEYGEDETPSKIDTFLNERFGDKLMDYVIYFSVALSIILSVAIFMVLPTWLSGIINNHLNVSSSALGIIEGFVRIGIFLVYIILTAQMKDIKRVFKYHGAEHKTINCFENNLPLTVENAKKQTRIHKRCGTSFLVFVMLVSMVVFVIVRTDVLLYRVISRVVLVPFIAGISYELIRLAGKSDNIIVRILSAPGMALQHITTKEPDDDMLEVAIASLKAVLEEEPESDC